MGTGRGYAIQRARVMQYSTWTKLGAVAIFIGFMLIGLLVLPFALHVVEVHAEFLADDQPL